MLLWGIPIRVFPSSLYGSFKFLAIYSLLLCFVLEITVLVGGQETWAKETGGRDFWADDNMGLSPEEEFLFMDESLVVSAAKYQQPLSQAPATIYVITDEEIRLSGLTDIGEILRLVPGLDVMAVTANQVEVSARGFNQVLANKMLVMIDGRSVYNTSYNFVAWNALPVVLDEIQRIEVILGPGSALYGANAFSGVIHIITKTPEEIQGIHLVTSMGTRNAFNNAISHGGVWKQWGWKVDAGWVEEDRWKDVSPDEWLAKFENAERRPAGESGETWRANGTVEYKPAADILWRFTGGISQGDTELLVQPEGGFFKLEAESYFASMLFHYGDLKLMAYHENGNFDWVPFQSITENTSMNCQKADFSGQYSLDPADWFKLTGGGNYRYNTIRWPRQMANSHQIQEASAFLQGVLRPFNDLAITLGGRYDRYEIVGEHLSYRGSLVYTGWKGNTLRFTAGNAFRNPSYLESYMHVRTPLFANYEMSIMGNSDLNPEAIQTYELAHLGGYFDKRLETRIVLYFNQYEDFIYTRVLDILEPQGIPLEIGFVNHGSAQAYGGEVSVDMEVAKGFDLFVNYSFQRLEFTSDDPFTPGNEKGMRITSSPAHKINSGARYRHDNGFSFNLLAHYVSPVDWVIGSRDVVEQRLDGYVLLNARIAYRCYGDRLEFALAGSNLLFDKHQEYPLGDRIGPQGFFSIRLDLENE